MGKIKEKLKEKKVLLSDGAWGTALHAMGLRSGECPELWNITNREKVLKVAKGYTELGIDMLETNSFGGSRFKLEQYGLGDRTFELNKAAAEISWEAAGESIIVLGSIGPTGKILLMGEVTEQEMYEAFKEQAIALALGGADAACIETMSALDEAVLAIKAVKDNTNLEIICTFTFEKTVKGDYKTMMGVTPEQMAHEVINAGAEIIGTNCGNGINGMIPIVRELRDFSPGIPILVHANAGIPQLEDGKTIFPETPEGMAKQVPDIFKAGANIIGGCCGTTPQHILAIKNILLVILSLFILCFSSCNQGKQKNKKEPEMSEFEKFEQGTFGYDLEVLKKNQDVIVLKSKNGKAQALLNTGYQGRVMTSTEVKLEYPLYGQSLLPAVLMMRMEY